MEVGPDWEPGAGGGGQFIGGGWRGTQVSPRAFFCAQLFAHAFRHNGDQFSPKAGLVGFSFRWADRVLSEPAGFLVMRAGPRTSLPFSPLVLTQSLQLQENRVALSHPRSHCGGAQLKAGGQVPSPTPAP